MLLSAIRSSYINTLGFLYDLSEIESIFSQITSFLLNYSKIDIHQNLTRSIDPQIEKKYMNCLESLKSGKPIQYVIGSTEFYHSIIRVDSRVLIPRPETEFMVDLIVKDQKPRRNLRIIDLCTGSGCIAIALAKKLDSSLITAMDLSEEALELASVNAQENNVKVDFVPDDLLTLHNKYPCYDLIVCNPPYVRESEKKLMHINVLDFEPPLALFVSDRDPLLFYRAIANFGLHHLVNERKVYAEINEIFGEEVKAIFLSSGYKKVEIGKDLQHKDRYLIACL
jgi:release factor glutamine methyltransferase